MARVFFRKVDPGHVTVSGIAITHLQASLNAMLPHKIDEDGIFGSATREMIRQYQTFLEVPVTGEMDDITWSSLMHSTEPSMFERALQVTAHFEGTGFTRVVGNFDGAGLTWGIIGFTLSNGELGGILADISKAYPTIFNKAFGSDGAVILAKTGLPEDQRVAWGDSISAGSNKMGVAEPWRTYFDDLGKFPAVQQMQLKRAHDRYWTIAVHDAGTFGLGEERDFALFYDVAVQNGGMKSHGREAKVKNRLNASPDKSLEKLRTIIEDVVVETSKVKWQPDVRSRKRAIRTGGGLVHGGNYRLSDWGIMAGVSPVSVE